MIEARGRCCLRMCVCRGHITIALFGDIGACWSCHHTRGAASSQVTQMHLSSVSVVLSVLRSSFCVESTSCTTYRAVCVAKWWCVEWGRCVVACVGGVYVEEQRGKGGTEEEEEEECSSTCDVFFSTNTRSSFEQLSRVTTRSLNVRCCAAQKLGERCRQTGKSCSVFRVRVARDASFVRSCAREFFPV